MRRLWRGLTTAVVVIFLLGGCASSSSKTAPSATAPSSEKAKAKASAKGASELPKPRRHHYLFAHRLLPQIFFSDTDPLLMQLRGDPSGEIGRFWISVGESLPSEDRLPPEGLTAEYSVRPDGIRMVLVTLPEARVTPEAIYAVLAVRGRDRWYLTYERSFDLFGSGKATAILCGWDSEGNHRNFGWTGDYSREAFEKALDYYFSKLPAPAGGFAPPKS